MPRVNTSDLGEKQGSQLFSFISYDKVKIYFEQFGGQIDAVGGDILGEELLVGVIAGQRSIDDFDVVAAQNNGILIKYTVFESVVLDVDQSFDGVLEEFADLGLGEVSPGCEFVLDD